MSTSNVSSGSKDAKNAQGDGSKSSQQLASNNEKDWTAEEHSNIDFFEVQHSNIDLPLKKNTPI